MTPTKSRKQNEEQSCLRVGNHYMKKKIPILLAAFLVLVIAVFFAFFLLYGPNFGIYLHKPGPQDYGERALAFMDNGYYSSTEDWKEKKAAAQEALHAAQSYEDTWPILREALSTAGGKHSRLITPAEMEESPEESVTLPLVSTDSLENGIVTVVIPEFTQSLSEASQTDSRVISPGTLNAQKVAIYVNGNNKRGIGHIYRALELADEFYVKPDIYYDINQTDPKVFGKTTHELKPVNGIAELFEICKREKYTVFINDILTTSIDYMIGLRSVLPDAKIINFEDDGEGIIKADLVFNALYSGEEYPQVYAGEQYYICGKTFMFYDPIKIKDKVERVFISFGGADPQNYSDRLLKIVSKPEYKHYYFVVALGRAKHNVEELMQYNQYENIEVHFDVANMPEMMSSCDVAITSKGRTSHELALLGVPSIAMAQNHREEKHGFVSNENGFSYIGLNPADEIIEATLKMYMGFSKEVRQHYQDMLLSHDLRGGRRRVMALINNL